MLSKQFFLGGNATFTVQNDTTGEHRTYKINLTEPSPKYPQPAYMVALLTGPDNESSFTYLGKLDPETGRIKLPFNGRMNNTPAVHGVAWTLGRTWKSMPIPTNIQIRHEGKCGCCGRKLTTPESLDRGIGPDCWSRLQG